MITKLQQITRKIWERFSGIEPRRLWSELTITQNELTTTQNELTTTQNELTTTQNKLTTTQNELTTTQNELTNALHLRSKRMHPFVIEALSLVSPVLQSQFQIPSKVNPDSTFFTEFGSDKDTRHSYGEIYFEILDQKINPKILEIGVGSVNDFPYAGLAAGGALQALRKKYPVAEIVGLDIDPQSIEKIKELGFYGICVDQTSSESLTAVRQLLSSHGTFDLIIDDGFHDPHANVRTLKVLFDLLNSHGTYVIEDVHESLIDFWKVISAHLPGKMEILDMRDKRPGVDDNILILFRK
jgi:SAM-dependent methyltransferase